MAKTRLDIIQRAARNLGLVSDSEALPASMDEFIGDTLDAMFAEFQASQGMSIGWALDETPDGAFLPLSRCVSAEVANHYGIPFEPWSKAVARFRAFAVPLDIPNSWDKDEDGIVTEAEEAIGKRAAYY